MTVIIGIDPHKAADVSDPSSRVSGLTVAISLRRPQHERILQVDVLLKLIGARQIVSVLVKCPRPCWSTDRPTFSMEVERLSPTLIGAQVDRIKLAHRYCTVSSRSPPVTKKFT